MAFTASGSKSGPPCPAAASCINCRILGIMVGFRVLGSRSEKHSMLNAKPHMGSSLKRASLL